MTDFTADASSQGVSSVAAVGTFRGTWQRSAATQGVVLTASAGVGVKPRSASVQGVGSAEASPVRVIPCLASAQGVSTPSYPVGKRRVIVTGPRTSSYEVVGPVVKICDSAYDVSDTIIEVVVSVWSGFEVAGLISKYGTSSYSIDRNITVPEETEMGTLVQLNGLLLNDGVNTFLRTGIKLPRNETTFDEVRSGTTGNIRQVDVRSPLTSAVLPLMFKAASPKALRALTDALTVEVLKGGTLRYQEGGEGGEQLPDVQTYTVGVSPAPEIIEDRMYRHNNIAIFDLTLVCLSP